MTRWNLSPSILVGLVLISAAYYYALGPLRRRLQPSTPLRSDQTWFFVASQITLVLALVSPLDVLGDQYLFSAHMVQHLLLVTVWPPLLLMSLPAWLVRPLFQKRGPSALLFFSAPAVALILFNGDMYAWHIPVLYDATLSNEAIHIVEHLTFMVFGLVNWLPVLSPIKEKRLSYPFQVLYLFLDGMLMMVLGILFTFAPNVFYPPYATAPILWGISHQTDQQIGGLVMWYPGNIPYGVALVVAFYRWFDMGGPNAGSREILGDSNLV